MRERIEALARGMARRAVATYTGRPRQERADVLVRLAIARLPAQGPLGNAEKLIVVALTHLVSEVPAGTPGYRELVEAVRALHARASR